MSFNPEAVEQFSIIKYIKKYRFSYGIYLFLRLIFAMLSLAIPYMICKCVDAVIEYHEVAYSKNLFFMLLPVIGMEFFLNCITNNMNVKLSNKIAFHIEFDTLHHIKYVPYKMIQKYDDAYLTQRINNAAVCIGDYVVEKIPYVISDVLLICLSAVVIAMSDKKVGAALAAVLLIYFAIYFCVKKVLAKRGEIMVEEQSGFFAMLSNQIFNMKSIKVNAWYDETDAEFRNGVTPFYESSIRFLRVDLSVSALTMLLNRLAYGSAIIILGIDLMRGEVSVGILATIVIYIELLLNKIQSVMKFGQEREQFKIARNKIAEIMRLPKEKNGSIRPEQINEITVRNLSVSYSDKVVFENMNLRMQKGKVYLLMGENGSGKTTFIHTILGVMEPTAGEIRYNEQEIENLDMYWIRKQKTGVTGQEPMMQNGTIYDNLFYGVEKKENGSEERQSIERLLAFVKNLEHGMNTRISAKNVSLSGGEKQRLAICRTLLKQGEVLIFDEPTSALDHEGILVFLELIEEIREKYLILIVSHDEKIKAVADEVIKI